MIVPFGGLSNGANPVENPRPIAKGLSRHASNIQINVFPLYEEAPSKRAFKQ